MNLGLSARDFQQFGHGFRRMSAVPEFGQQHTLDLRALRTAIQRADADECIVRKHQILPRIRIFASVSEDER